MKKYGSEANVWEKFLEDIFGPEFDNDGILKDEEFYWASFTVMPQFWRSNSGVFKMADFDENDIALPVLLGYEKSGKHTVTSLSQ